MLLNFFVFAELPSSTSEKFVGSGDGDAVKENDVEAFGCASLIIVIEAGKMTASLVRDRS